MTENQSYPHDIKSLIDPQIKIDQNIENKKFKSLAHELLFSEYDD